MMPLREAVIEKTRYSRATVDEVARYLPSGYTAVGEPDGTIRITGRDHHGWTLDGYVIPRLQSGMIYAHEVEPTAESIAADGYRRFNP